MMVLFVLVRFGPEIGGLPEGFKEALRAQSSHSHIALLRFANIFVMIALALWLIVVAPTHPNRLARWAGKGLRGLILWRPFVFLGQHSLQVYSFHVLLVYAVSCLLAAQHWPNLSQQMLSLACAMSLLLPAYVNRWRLARAD
jgi:peptidoglycan/LPS O-acetylase OafA/YrhL